MKEMNVDEVLLVLRNDGALLPVYRGALGEAAGWPWTVKRLYAGALVVSLSGTAMMAEVDIVGPAGGSAFAKILSVLNSNWNITVRLKECQMGLASIVAEVGKGLRANTAARRGLFDLPDAELLARIERAGSIAELFQILGIGRPEFEALDAL